MRVERDSLGTKAVPADVYYGIQTLRALELFHTTGVPASAHPHFIGALAMVKKAAAAANQELGVLDKDIASAIIQACNEVVSGQFLAQFPLDILQATDTSFNMNINEVLANRASEILGGQKGEYKLVHPNDHVNRSQSTNDVVHTALKVACIHLGRQLCEALQQLAEAYQRKAKESFGVIKMGRTCLQDAVPMTLGQEFQGYGSIIMAMRESICKEEPTLSIVNLGATAVGTEVNASPEYRRVAVQKLSEFSECSLQGASDLFGATQNEEAVALLMGRLKTLAVSLSKMASDLALLSSGPQAGLQEIKLSALQPGSSIMPGKVNPVVPMLMNQVAYIVTGYDVAVSMAVAGGQLELNANGSAIGYCVLESFKLLLSAIDMLTNHCVAEITVNREACEAYARRSASAATALVPLLGYEKAASIAKDALASGRPVLEVVVEQGLLDRRRAEEILDPWRLIGPTGADARPDG